MAFISGKSVHQEYLKHGQECRQQQKQNKMGKNPSLAEKYEKWVYTHENTPSFSGWYAIRILTNKNLLIMRPDAAYWTSKKWVTDPLSSEKHPQEERIFCYISQSCDTKDKALEIALDCDPDVGCQE